MANRSKRSACVVCKGNVQKVGALSYRGICATCAEKRVAASVRQLRAKKGPMHERWVEGMVHAALDAAGAGVPHPSQRQRKKSPAA